MKELGLYEQYGQSQSNERDQKPHSPLKHRGPFTTAFTEFKDNFMTSKPNPGRKLKRERGFVAL